MSVITSVTPAVSLVDGQPVTTSQNIAAVFGKAHDDVLRRIRTVKCSAEFSARNFAAAEYIDDQGKPRPAYRITRDGCAFLVMGFTGRRAAAFKEAYIDAFNRMEAELHGKSTAEPSHLPLAGTRWLVSHDGKAQPSMQPVPSNAVVIDPTSHGDIRALLQEMLPLDVLGHALQVAAHRLTTAATAERTARMAQFDPAKAMRSSVPHQGPRI